MSMFDSAASRSPAVVIVSGEPSPTSASSSSLHSPKSPDSASFATSELKLQQDQRKLLLLYHAATCSRRRGGGGGCHNKNNSNCCTVAHCDAIQRLYQHILQCTNHQNGLGPQDCPVPGCRKSRNIWRHYRKCTLEECRLCQVAPTRPKLQQQYLANNPNTTNVVPAAVPPRPDRPPLSPRKYDEMYASSSTMSTTTSSSTSSLSLSSSSLSSSSSGGYVHFRALR